MRLKSCEKYPAGLQHLVEVEIRSMAPIRASFVALDGSMQAQHGVICQPALHDLGHMLGHSQSHNHDVVPSFLPFVLLPRAWYTDTAQI